MTENIVIDFILLPYDDIGQSKDKAYYVTIYEDKGDDTPVFRRIKIMANETIKEAIEGEERRQQLSKLLPHYKLGKPGSNVHNYWIPAPPPPPEKEWPLYEG